LVAANYRVVLSVSIATLYKNGFVEINTICEDDRWVVQIVVIFTACENEENKAATKHLALQGNNSCPVVFLYFRIFP
jgi:hypothetical protein